MIMLAFQGEGKSFCSVGHDLLHLVAFKKAVCEANEDSLPIAEQSATVGSSVLAVAVLAKRTGGLCELDLHEEGS